MRDNRAQKEIHRSELVDGLMVIQQVKKAPLKKKEIPKKRVAAYCRVSSDNENQDTSFDNQVRIYTEKISSRPDWIFAGIYADDGKTGTQIKARDEYLRMIEDARAGKIDVILIKSVSRLSRNTVDFLNTVREMKQLGVEIYAEKEKLNCTAAESELLLAVYASFSQEESRSLSENMKRGLRNQFELGKPRYCRILGYKTDDDKNWVIVEEEADAVRQIFDLYNKGYSNLEVCRKLEEREIQPASGKDGWNAASLNWILKNEKYMGDFLMQKTYVADHLSHKRVANDGKNVKQFYMKDHHPAIVSRESFALAQKMLAFKVENGTKQYPYYGFLRCPYCGRKLVCYKPDTNIERKMWVCPGGGDSELWSERKTCPEFWIKHYSIEEAFIKALKRYPKEDAVNAMLERLKESGEVQYYFLDALVEKIEFPDFDTMQVSWKNGTSTKIKMKYKYERDYPVHELVEQDGQYILNGELLTSNAPQKAAHIKGIKEQLLQMTVRYPEDPEGIPAVRKG